MDSLADVFGCWFQGRRFHFLGCGGDFLDDSFNRKVAVQYAKSCTMIYKEYFLSEYQFEDELLFEFGFCHKQNPDGHMFGACLSDDGTTYTMYINPTSLIDHRHADSELILVPDRDKLLYQIWTIAVHEMSHVFTDYFLQKVDHDDEFTSVQHLINEYFWDQNKLFQKLIVYPCSQKECCHDSDLACCVSRQFKETVRQRQEGLGELDVTQINIPKVAV